MALWQFGVLLVPQRSLKALFGQVPERVSEQALDRADWWGEYELSEEDERLISSLAAPRRSWSPKIKSWGEEDGNRIHILREDGRVAEVSARIDARDIDRGFLYGVVHLADRWACALITDDLRVLPPLVSEMEVALEESTARRFVRDPEKFLGSDGPPTT